MLIVVSHGFLGPSPFPWFTGIGLMEFVDQLSSPHVFLCHQVASVEGDPFHYTRDPCAAPVVTPPGRTRRQMLRCFRCNQLGHRSAKCPALAPLPNLRGMGQRQKWLQEQHGSGGWWAVQLDDALVPYSSLPADWH
ncbi:hypothetical protein L345_05020, partial [Ophiophagus hannah]